MIVIGEKELDWDGRGDKQEVEEEGTGEGDRRQEGSPYIAPGVDYLSQNFEGSCRAREHPPANTRKTRAKKAVALWSRAIHRWRLQKLH